MTTEQSENSTFPFEVNGEIVDLKDKILESGKKLSEIMTPVMAHIRFDAFQEHLKKRDYKNVYTSDVYKTIVKLCEKPHFVTLEAGTKVLRARIIKDLNEIYQSKHGIHMENDTLRGYDWYNSKEPAVGISSEGRANSQFSSYFYCATDGPTAACEIKANIGDYISLASFTIKRELKLIKFEEKNLSDEITMDECFKNIISRCFSVPVRDSQEYRLTQFISDEIRKHGVDGICYKSHFTNNNNYVIFNCSMNTIEFVNSKIILLHSQQLNFVDFSSNKMIRTTSLPDLNETEIQTEKSHIMGIMDSYKNELNNKKCFSDMA